MNYDLLGNTVREQQKSRDRLVRQHKDLIDGYLMGLRDVHGRRIRSAASASDSASGSASGIDVCAISLF